MLLQPRAVGLLLLLLLLQLEQAPPRRLRPLCMGWALSEQALPLRHPLQRGLGGWLLLLPPLLQGVSPAAPPRLSLLLLLLLPLHLPSHCPTRMRPAS